MHLVAEGSSLRVGALLQHKTQCPQSGIGAGENDEDHDQHVTSPRRLLL